MAKSNSNYRISSSSSCCSPCVLADVQKTSPLHYYYRSPQILPISSIQQKRALSVYTSPEDDCQEDERPPLLVALDHVQLQYPNSTDTMHLNLHITHPDEGGHVLLARNGTGKSLISSALVAGFQMYRDELKREQQQQQQQSSSSSSSSALPSNLNAEDYFKSGQLTLNQDIMWHGQAMGHVSFESHEALLNQIDDKTGKPFTVRKAISSGTLSKAAQFLIVRFGMFPLLTRCVTTLSTGEIRKTLIIRALSQRPRLLVLDNAFDGLDVPSRNALKDLTSRTLQGFRPDILVQGVDAKATAHTQIVLLTHRAEEIVDPIRWLTYWNENKNQWTTEERNGRTSQELMDDALSLGSHDPSPLPTVPAIMDWWERGRKSNANAFSFSLTMVETENLHVRRGDSTLLTDLHWRVQSGQHWWIAGGNGVGKSTLSRLLAREEAGLQDGSTIQVGGSETHFNSDNQQLQQGDRLPFVGWVSTESHMALVRSPLTTKEVLVKHSPQHDETSLPDALSVLEWLDLPTSEDFLKKPFAQLSQGEQKLVLIASALASRPSLLVLDEPCQGLDQVNRKRVLELVELFCQATTTTFDSTAHQCSLIYITHHPEEVMPCVNHVLHLAKGGRDVYQGTRQNYDMDAVTAEADSINAAAINAASEAAKSSNTSSRRNSLV